MLKLKIDMKDMESDQALTNFTEGVFLARNWDLFLSLLVVIDEETLVALLDYDLLGQLSQKIDLYVQIEPKNATNKINLKDTLFKHGVKLHDPTEGSRAIDLNDITDFDSVDNVLLEILDFEKGNGLVPTIVQDLDNVVLMLAYSSPESLKLSIETRRATYFSRSREQIWIKGEQSGNYQVLKSIRYDCDADALLFQVDQISFACHAGSYSCFQYSEFSIPRLFRVIQGRIDNATTSESYTKRLAENRELLLSKIKEESSEVINFTDRDNLVWEIADLTYLLLVLMATQDIAPNEIVNELRRRHK